MKKKLNLIIIFVFAIMTLAACSESKPVDTSGEPKIYPIENNNTYYSDTLTVWGEHLGAAQDSSYVVINDTLRIKSANCIKWTESKIMLLVPQLPYNSTLYVVIDGKKNYIDATTYYMQLNVEPLPGFEQVLIAHGTYKMGGNFGFADELPIHDVTLTHDLMVASCETSQRIYGLVMNNNPSLFKDNMLPVHNIIWLDAVKFCNAISELYSLKPAYTISGANVSWDMEANGWRLPTEAEWEYISQVDTAQGFNLDDYAWHSVNSGLQPHFSAQKLPNIHGLYDVLGNVSEWCWDYYQANYYSISPLVNPKGPQNGIERVMRGGSCDDGKAFVRVQKRKASANKYAGIRLVRNAE